MQNCTKDNTTRFQRSNLEETFDSVFMSIGDYLLVGSLVVKKLLKVTKIRMNKNIIAVKFCKLVEAGRNFCQQGDFKKGLPDL